MCQSLDTAFKKFNRARKHLLIQNKDLSLFNAFTFTPNTGCYKIVFIKRVKKALKIAGVLQVVCSTKRCHINGKGTTEKTKVG